MTLYGTLLVEARDGPPTRYTLEGATASIGRGPENDVVLLDLKVSRRHAVMRCDGDQIQVEDQGSANGFKHNGRRVRKAQITDGDSLIIGSTQLWFYAPGRDLQEQETALTELGTVMEQTITDHSVPKLIVTRGGESRAYPVFRKRVSIGRSAKNDINISRLHAEVLFAEGRYFLRDNDSSNGTLVADVAITECELQSGMTFEVGDAQITFQAPFDAGELSVVDTAIVPRAAPVAADAKGPSIERVGQRGVEAPQAVPARAPTRAVAKGRQPVIVVPGFMGSMLLDQGRPVWPDVKRFLKRPDFLRLPDSIDLTPGGLVSEVVVVPGLVKLDAYNRLSEYLVEGLGYRHGENLFAFTYDWRRDLRHAARQLGELISVWEEQVDQRFGKFVIIAHSAGGLVARYYIERMGGRHHVDRLILMGSPNQGTLKTLAAMLGRINLLPFGARKERMRDVMATFPAAYQLLPLNANVLDSGGAHIDLFSDRDWIPDEVHPLLDDARAFIGETGTRSRVPVVSIFGYGQKTITRIDVKRDRAGRLVSPTYHEDDRGDGTVSQQSAILEGSEIHPVRQHHGALYTDNDVKMRLRLELLGQP